MASDESMTMVSSMQEDEYDDTDDGGLYVFDHPHQLQLQLQQHSLSRLSMCTSSMYTNEEGEDFVNSEDMKMFMSRLSIESFDGHDADEEFSDEKEFKGLQELSSDSDKEPGCYSLPATPPRRRNQVVGHKSLKDYASENEAQKGLLMKGKMRRMRRRRVVREMGFDEDDEKKKDDVDHEEGLSGESEGGVSGVVVITRPKGGKRSLCMDLEEMKACRDLGFELEHERMLEMPRSSSAVDTSSGGNSPIANWRISSPGLCLLTLCFC